MEDFFKFRIIEIEDKKSSRPQNFISGIGTENYINAMIISPRKKFGRNVKRLFITNG